MKGKMKSIKQFVRNNKRTIATVGITVAAVAVPEIAMAANTATTGTTDLLSSQNTTVTNTFGAQSSVVRWVYIAEVFMSLMAYWKVRTPMVFIGLIMVMIFTRIAFGLIG